jgi:hypothetical protein
MLWARHLLNPEDQRKRKERLRNLRIEKLERQGKKAPSKRSRKAATYRYNMRTDSEPTAVRAFWGMHVEAMNWSGMGDAEYVAALGLSPTRSGSGAIASWIPARRGTGDRCFIRVPGRN